jgi:ADP-ribose pyrophosphatase
VSGPLSDQQRTALDRYEQLITGHPELIAGRARRPIIRDRQILEEYAVQHDVTLGVTAHTPYLWLINDLVRSSLPDGSSIIHPYLRLIATPESLGTCGVVVVATIPSADSGGEQMIVLVEQERHATGQIETELPRGFGLPGIQPADHALTELRQETGYLGEHAEHLGTTLTDTGTSDGAVSFYHIPVTSHAEADPEAYEAITKVTLLPVSEAWNRIEAGTIRDAFTIQGLALWERYQRRVQGGTPISTGN